MRLPIGPVVAERPALAFDPRFVWIVGLVAVNGGIGVAIGGGIAALGIFIAAVPVLVVAAWLAVQHREWIFILAFALGLNGFGFLSDSLPGVSHLYPADLLVGVAVASWIVARAVGSPSVETRWPRTIVLSWPLALFAVALLLGLIRGHDRWGESYLSQPMRVLLYAAVAAAITGMSAKFAYRSLVALFYTDTVWQTILALYHLATGTSATSSTVLSTGGTRTVALSTSMYLAGALFLAILNVDRSRHARGQLFHLGVGALALFDIIVSFGRTTFAAIVLLVPLLLLGLRHARRSVLAFIPLIAPVLVLAVLVAIQVKPSLPSTFAQRLTGPVGSDASVETRQRKNHAALQGLSQDPLLGMGFGRRVQWVRIDGRVQQFSGDPEDSYVWILAGGGLFALSSFLLMMVAFFVDGFRRLRGATGDSRALLIFAMSMTFVFLLSALTGPILSTSRFLLTVWLCLLLPSLVQPVSGALPALSRGAGV